MEESFSIAGNENMRSVLLLVFVASVAYADFSCPSSDGFFANPDDCASFYQCAGNIAYYFACAADTLYNEDVVICDHAQNVNCGSRPVDGEVVDDGDDEVVEEEEDEDDDDGDYINETEYDNGDEDDEDFDDVDDNDVEDEDEDEGDTDVSSSGILPLPSKVMGVYLGVSADTVPGYETGSNWTPRLYPYQQAAANVLFLTFINPRTMEVPKAFANLAATRGSGADGAVPQNTVVLFSIGGLAYSESVNPWQWLQSRGAAEAMAEEVAQWPSLYPGCDGIDMDIETGAGESATAAQNIVYFLERLNELNPSMIVVIPTFGYPQIAAQITAINANWDQEGNSRGIVDSIGIMVYEGTTSLDWVDEYTEPLQHGWGWPITADVPEDSVWVGVKGSDSSSVYTSLASSVSSRGLGGMIVWWASVKGGSQYMYDSSWDASLSQTSKQGMVRALQTMAK